MADRSAHATYTQCVSSPPHVGLIDLPTSFGTDIPRMSYDPALRLRRAALTGFELSHSTS